MKKILFYCWLSLSFALMAITSVMGQNVKCGKGDRYWLPNASVLTVKVIQKESPVQIESIDVLTDAKGSMPIIDWKLKNNSSKIVKRYIVSIKIRTNIDQWRGFTGGQTQYDIGIGEKRDLILPQSTFQEYDFSACPSLATGNLGELFTFDRTRTDRAFIVVYAMIKKVVFADGSSFDEPESVFEES